ncbi:hypothetical protein Tco_0152639 [Tanacetum coccineum]
MQQDGVMAYDKKQKKGSPSLFLTGLCQEKEKINFDFLSNVMLKSEVDMTSEEVFVVGIESSRPNSSISSLKRSLVLDDLDIESELPKGSSNTLGTGTWSLARIRSSSSMYWAAIHPCFSIKKSTTYSPKGELISKSSSLTSVVGKGVGITHLELLSDVTSDSLRIRTRSSTLDFMNSSFPLRG